MKKNNIEIGDSVKVKKGTLCTEITNLCIEGWQGRVSEITEDEVDNMLVCIDWDSITLKNMPDSFIELCEEDGSEYNSMYLRPDEVELTQARDKEEEDEMAAFEAWWNYLAKKLNFPFDAIITGGPDKGPLQTGDKVSVKRISLVEDFYGIIVELRRGHNKYDHPLCDMEVINTESSNYQPVNDYCTWYGNH